MKKTLILNTEEIKQKTRRIAYQVLEDNYEEKELVMIGIKPNGFEYAEQLKKEIEAIDGIKITLLELKLNKQKPLSEEINVELGKLSLDKKAVLIVDDVANTGKTLCYALKPIMEYSRAKCRPPF